MTEFETLMLPADRLPGDCVVALFFQDQKPLEGPAGLLDWRLDGRLTRMLLDGELTGRAGEHVVLQNNGKLESDWILFVGGGQWEGLCLETYAALLSHALKSARQAGFKDVSICLAAHEEADSEELEKQARKALQEEGEGLSHCRFSCLNVTPPQ
jgi:hypothetical protein